MNANKNYSKKIIAQAVINKIEETSSPDDIKTKYLEEYSTPQVIELKYEKEKAEMLYPDIIAEYSNRTNLYEIELDEEINSQKWKFMSHYATQNNGNFHIIIPDFMRDRVKRSLKENGINAALLYFDTQSARN